LQPNRLSTGAKADAGTSPDWDDVRLGGGMLIRDSRRMDPSPVVDAGLQTRHSIACGNLDVIRGNLEYRSDYELEITGPDLIKIGFTKTSRLHLQFGSTKLEHFLDYSSSIIAQPAGMVKRQRAVCGTRDESAILIIRPELLNTVFPFRSGEIPEPLRSLAEGSLGDFFWQQYPMTAPMQRGLLSILEIDTHDRLSELQIELKSLELFYQFVKSLCGFTRPEVAHLTSADRNRLHEVWHLLSQDFEAPPSLSKLAASVGMCRSRLVAGFKQEFGTTIGAFCQERRMEEARRLIVNSDEPLGLIGYKVGYDHPSSFTSAYKAYFGRAPKEDRVTSSSRTNDRVD
jgi:AraC family transcriptional activator of pyochelin receptor